LTSIVVREDTGSPCAGFRIEEVPAKQQDVFRYDWYAIVPPNHVQG